VKLAAAIAIVLSIFTFTAPASAQSHSYTINGVWLSTYDYWNNSPPGCGIEYARDYGYPTVHHNCAGGNGTYANPITYAAQNSGVFNLRPGTRVYIPYFRKYFILEDLCSSCYTSKPQMDLWVGGVSAQQNNDQSPHDIVNLWQQRTVIVNPVSNLPVNMTPFKNVRI
jgi:hypothetical protein